MGWGWWGLGSLIVASFFYSFRVDMIPPAKGEILFPENNSKLHDLYEQQPCYSFLFFFCSVKHFLPSVLNLKKAMFMFIFCMLLFIIIKH